MNSLPQSKSKVKSPPKSIRQERRYWARINLADRIYQALLQDGEDRDTAAEIVDYLLFRGAR